MPRRLGLVEQSWLELEHHGSAEHFEKRCLFVERKSQDGNWQCGFDVRSSGSSGRRPDPATPLRVSPLSAAQQSGRGPGQIWRHAGSVEHFTSAIRDFEAQLQVAGSGSC